MAKRERKYHYHTELRKQITACLDRARVRHGKVQLRLLHSETQMAKADYKRLLAWQADWEKYLRQQRSLLHNGKSSGPNGPPSGR